MDFFEAIRRDEEIGREPICLLLVFASVRSFHFEKNVALPVEKDVPSLVEEGEPEVVLGPVP